MVDLKIPVVIVVLHSHRDQWPETATLDFSAFELTCDSRELKSSSITVLSNQL